MGGVETHGLGGDGKELVRGYRSSIVECRT